MEDRTMTTFEKIAAGLALMSGLCAIGCALVGCPWAALTCAVGGCWMLYQAELDADEEDGEAE
jgi:hypothetical protein